MSGPADIFREMAARIEKMDPREFAGAAVVVCPGDEGQTIAFLLTDPTPDILQFLSSIKTRVEIASANAMEEARTRQGGFGR